MPTNTNTYSSLIEQVRDHLRNHGVDKWPDRLDIWLKDLSSLDSDALTSHLKRTQKSLGGMGSIADIVISSVSDHAVENDQKSMQEANNRLMHLTEQLDAEITRLLISSQ